MMPFWVNVFSFSFFLSFFLCIYYKESYLWAGGFGGLVASVLASGTQVRGFKPGRSRRIFKGGKILSTPSFGREVKLWVPCKRSLNVLWKSALSKITGPYSPPISSNFRR
jgi:hypothetical protein